MRQALVLLAGLLVLPLAVYAQEAPPPPTEETVTVSRTEFDSLKAAVEALTREVQQLKGQPATAAPAPAEAPPAEASAAPPTETTDETVARPAGGRALSLPDISLVVQARGKLSDDHRDEARNRLRLSEAELGIQGYVYPNVKADAFIAMSPEEDEAAQVEEAYLTYLSLRPGLNAYVGRKHVPFGRTNLIHNHSWLYVRQPLVLRNLVSEEALAGDGLSASYILPTSTDYFAQLELGAWSGEGPGETGDLPDIVAGPGAGFSDRFYTARLWASHALNPHTELELGGSYAWGDTPGFGPRTTTVDEAGRARLTGVDLTYRHYGEGTKRLLLRAEGVSRHEKLLSDASTSLGYYLFANYRKDKYASWGALYDWSEFPQAPDLHESAFSLIYTKQMSEQYLIRLQGTRGSRPAEGDYNELFLQWIWGVGPHTHNLE